MDYILVIFYDSLILASIRRISTKTPISLSSIHFLSHSNKIWNPYTSTHTILGNLISTYAKNLNLTFSLISAYNTSFLVLYSRFYPLTVEKKNIRNTSLATSQTTKSEAYLWPAAASRKKPHISFWVLFTNFSSKPRQHFPCGLCLKCTHWCLYSHNFNNLSFCFSLK